MKMEINSMFYFLYFLLNILIWYLLLNIANGIIFNLSYFKDKFKKIIIIIYFITKLNHN
jgi:hypothetical protein